MFPSTPSSSVSFVFRAHFASRIPGASLHFRSFRGCISSFRSAARSARFLCAPTEPATQTLFVCVCASSLLNPFRSIFDVFERFAHSQSTRDRVAADMTSEMCIAIKEKEPIMGPDYEVALPLCCPRQCHSCPVECGKGEERVIIIKKTT